MLLKKLLILCVGTIAVSSCIDLPYTGDPCRFEWEEQIECLREYRAPNITLEEQTDFPLRDDVGGEYSISSKVEMVFYNMRNGEFTELGTTFEGETDNYYAPSWKQFTNASYRWGIEEKTHADCVGIRYRLKFGDGSTFTIFGWRDDSNPTLTTENSLQGVGYINREEKFIRSNMIPGQRDVEGILYRYLRYDIAVDKDYKVHVGLHNSLFLTYKEAAQITGEETVNNGDYFADPDPSRCNIINSP